MVHVDFLVILAVSVATRIINPQIVSFIYKPEAKRFFTSCYDSHAAVQNTMLINHNRLSDFSICQSYGIFFGFGARNPVDSVYMAILRTISVLFIWVAELTHDELLDCGNRLIRQLFLRLLNVCFYCLDFHLGVQMDLLNFFANFFIKQITYTLHVFLVISILKIIMNLLF